MIVRQLTPFSPPRLTMPSFPQGDAGAVREAARLLAAAERPLIRTGKLARTSAGWDGIIELAELLQAPVDVGGYASWQDFPSWHALYGSGGLGGLMPGMTGLPGFATARGSTKSASVKDRFKKRKR